MVVVSCPVMKWFRRLVQKTDELSTYSPPWNRSRTMLAP